MFYVKIPFTKVYTLRRSLLTTQNFRVLYWVALMSLPTFKFATSPYWYYWWPVLCGANVATNSQVRNIAILVLLMACI